MPSLSLGLHPTTLASLNPAMSTSSSPSAPAPTPQPMPPGILGNRPGQNPYAYAGNTNPGAFVAPAPFNPMLALTLLSSAGQIPGGGGASGGRGPIGGFGVGTTPNPLLNPRSRNPYVGGF